MDLENYPMRAVVNLNCIWHRVIEKAMADLGLSSIQSRMLGYLYVQLCQDKKVLQKELEEEFKIRKSSVTSVIQMLEKKGLVRRIGVPGDARKKEVVLTEYGISVQRTVLERLETLEHMVDEVLSPEEKKLWHSCIRKIATRLEETEYD